MWDFLVELCWTTGLHESSVSEHLGNRGAACSPHFYFSFVLSQLVKKGFIFFKDEEIQTRCKEKKTIQWRGGFRKWKPGPSLKTGRFNDLRGAPFRVGQFLKVREVDMSTRLG